MREKIRRNRLAEKLKILRMNAGLNQVALARLLGVTQVTVSLYESGRREPDLDDLMTIAEKLGTTPNDLLGFDAAALPHINAGNHSPIAIVNGDNNVVQAPPPSLRSMQRARGAPSETSRNKKSTEKKGKRR